MRPGGDVAREAAADVIQDEADAGEAIHLAQHLHRLSGREVVQRTASRGRRRTSGPASGPRERRRQLKVTPGTPASVRRASARISGERSVTVNRSGRLWPIGPGYQRRAGYRRRRWPDRGFRQGGRGGRLSSSPGRWRSTVAMPPARRLTVRISRRLAASSAGSCPAWSSISSVSILRVRKLRARGRELGVGSAEPTILSPPYIQPP